MQKLIASLFLICGLLPEASASDSSTVRVASDGQGEVLIIPFFTVQNDWDTYINITRDTRTLHIKIRDGETGKVVSAYNVYSLDSLYLSAVLHRTDEGKTQVKFGSIHHVKNCLVGGGGK